MPAFPKSEWDLLLQSNISLSGRVAFQFDSQGSRYLYDRETQGCWRLETWQGHLLDRLERGGGFASAVSEVVRKFPARANRGSIAELVLGLRKLGFLKVGRHSRPSGKTPLPARPAFSFFPVRWAFHLCLALGLAGAVGGGLGLVLSVDDVVAGRNALTVFETDWPSDGNGMIRPDRVPVEIRTWSHGILREVLVSEGEKVGEGAVLARISDPEAKVIGNDLRLSISEARQRRDEAYQAEDMVAYHRESRALATLTRDLSQWEEFGSGTEIRAPVAGRITAMKTVDRIGGKVEPGETLMAIEGALSEPSEVSRDELLATIP